MEETLVPPNNTKAEIQILGSLMLDPETFEIVEGRIQVDDFYLPRHQLIFQAILSLRAKGMSIDLVTVNNELRSKSDFDEKIGGIYLAQVVEETISTAHLESYCDIVKEKSLQRKIIACCREIQTKSFKSDFSSVGDLIEFAQSRVFSLDAGRSMNSVFTDAMTMMRTTIPEIEKRSKMDSFLAGHSTGFKNLDSYTQGLKGGEMIIVAARPSMGKTAFSLNLTHNLAVEAKKKVAYFSIEMPKEQLVMRMLASAAGIDMARLSLGKVYDNEWSKLMHSANIIADAELYIDDSSMLSPFELKSRCRWLKATKGLDCVVIDYLQLMRLKSGRIESKEREVAEISQALKALSKELNIPVVALAQLNREADKRPDKRPVLSDLRDSGSIEMDADIIMMLFREDYYDRTNPDVKGHAEVIVGKNRNGQTGIAKMHFNSKFNRFEERGGE